MRTVEGSKTVEKNANPRCEYFVTLFWCFTMYISSEQATLALHSRSVFVSGGKPSVFSSSLTLAHQVNPDGRSSPFPPGNPLQNTLCISSRNSDVTSSFTCHLFFTPHVPRYSFRSLSLDPSRFFVCQGTEQGGEKIFFRFPRSPFSRDRKWRYLRYWFRIERTMYFPGHRAKCPYDFYSVT